ncbi:MAG: phenylacetate-CoA oxygenase/reductase subunit PaaK [Chitinophagaceae bacterium]|nr:phenylacetate-CoA oxygenase/reductase subunit PaaK [Chitinophagaceae bacterium]
MIHFVPLKVRDIKRETADCVSISFDIAADQKETFVFKQGQSLTLRAIINGEEVRRSYSICSSPFDNELRIAVKNVEGGVFSNYANSTLHKGDVLDVMPPIGKFFTELDEKQIKNYVAIAAGSGITPIISIIKTTLLTEPNSQFLLVFGNKNRQSIIFKEEIEALKNRFINRFSVMHILSRERTDSPINFGRIDQEKCNLLFEKAILIPNTDEFFICGPEEMIMTVKERLEAMGVERKRIHFELFTTAGLKKQTKAINQIQKTGNIQKSKVTIKLDGSSFDFDLAYEGENVLDAALANGADLPYSCKSGVCCTCRAKLVEGEVDMEINYGLEPEEIEQGFILTCQSHPRSEKVVVDFDVK